MSSSSQLVIAAPRTPTAQRSQSVFPSPSDCPGPRTPIKALGTPGRSKFGLARSEIGTSSSVAKISGLIAGSPHRSPSPSPRREASVVSDIKPTQTELGISSGRAGSVARTYRARSIFRAGSVASSLSPSESASQIGGTGSRAQSTISRASRAVPYPSNSRARTMTRSPAPPVREPLFSNPDDDDDDGDDDGVTCLSPGGDLDYTPGDDDDVATILPEAGGKRLAANVSPSKSSRVSGSVTSSVGSIVDTPKFKPHPLGMDSVELQMLNQDILSLLFANPANKEGLRDICKEYGFQSPVDLKRMMTETIRRAADSNDGKFLTTSIEDPRKSYKPSRVINDPDCPLN